jgi:hypothetical protein
MPRGALQIAFAELPQQALGYAYRAAGVTQNADWLEVLCFAVMMVAATCDACPIARRADQASPHRDELLQLAERLCSRRYAADRSAAIKSSTAIRRR